MKPLNRMKEPMKGKNEPTERAPLKRFHIKIQHFQRHISYDHMKVPQVNDDRILVPTVHSNGCSICSLRRMKSCTVTRICPRVN